MATPIIPEEHLLELLLTLKRTTAAEAKGILNQQPQIAYALMAVMVNINAVKMEVVQDILAKYVPVPAPPRGPQLAAPPAVPSQPPSAIPPHMQAQIPPPRGGTPTYPPHVVGPQYPPQNYPGSTPAPPPNQLPGLGPPPVTHAAQAPPPQALHHMHASPSPLPATPQLPDALTALPEEQKEGPH